MWLERNDLALVADKTEGVIQRGSRIPNSVKFGERFFYIIRKEFSHHSQLFQKGNALLYEKRVQRLQRIRQENEQNEHIAKS